MAKFTRLEVLNTIVNTGLVPVFYNGDVEVTKKVAWAISTGGCRLLEFTNRGDFAPEVFKDLSRYCQQELPNLILGVGSILDAPTAALYVAYGANFVVGPNTNPEVARFCNRRKISYSPGCGSATEIAEAEELGVEIVKVFPGYFSLLTFSFAWRIFIAPLFDNSLMKGFIMEAVKIMPCLDMKDGRVVKGVHFVNLIDAGDPVKNAEFYQRRGGG